MSLSDEAADAARIAELGVEQAKTADARRERDAAKHALLAARTEVDELTSKLKIVDQIAALDPSPPKWLTPKRAKTSAATLVTMLSDCHFDEVVDPDEMGGINAYDRDIGTMRLKRYTSKVIELSRDHLAGLEYDGCVLSLNGDLITGELHDLIETNADTVPGTILYWLEHLCAVVDAFADEFGKVHVPVTVGNHGRRTRKPRTKKRIRDNYDWLLGCLVAREFRDDDRVTFDIPETVGSQVPVYSRMLRFEHGDLFKGGSGIAGIWSPIARGHAKRSAGQAAVDQPYDLLCLGHWHQLIYGPSWCINGSSKGYDEYALQGGFGFEPPQQALWVETPEHGMTWRGPVLVADRKNEGW